MNFLALIVYVLYDGVRRARPAGRGERAAAARGGARGTGKLVISLTLQNKPPLNSIAKFKIYTCRGLGIRRKLTPSF